MKRSSGFLGFLPLIAFYLLFNTLLALFMPDSFKINLKAIYVRLEAISVRFLCVARENRIWDYSESNVSRDFKGL